MPLLENLAEGFANAAGATGAAQGIENQKRQRTQLSDAERNANLDVYNQALDKLTTGIGQIDPAQRNPQNPEWARLNDALHKTISSRNALFHPQHGPAAMDKLAEMLHIKKPAVQPANAGEAKQGMADFLSQTIPYQPGEFAGMSQADQLHARRIKAGLDPRATEPKPDAENWVLFNGKMNGKDVTLQRNSKSGEITDLAGNAVPKDQLSGFQVAGKPAPGAGSKFNEILGSYEKKWNKKKEDFTPEDYSYINQKIAHDSAREGTNTAVRFEKNDKNEIVPVEYTNTRGIGPEPVDPNAAKPTATPGDLKRNLKPAASTPSGPKVKVGEPIMTAANPAANKADQEYNAAVKVDSLAKQAQESKDPVQQRQLALALIRGMAGRVNMQEFQQYTTKMGVPNTIEGFINGLSTGQMPTGVVTSLVKAAHANLKASEDAKVAAHSGGGTQKTYKQTATGPGGHKIGSDDGQTWVDVQTGKPVQ